MTHHRIICWKGSLKGHLVCILLHSCPRYDMSNLELGSPYRSSISCLSMAAEVGDLLPTRDRSHVLLTSLVSQLSLHRFVLAANWETFYVYVLNVSPNFLLYGVAPVSVSLSLKQQEDSSQQDDLTDWCFWAFWVDSSSLSVRNHGENHHFPRQQRRSGVCHHDEFRKSVRAAEIYTVSNFFFFLFSCSFCAEVNNFSETGKQDWNNHKSQANKYCGKQICFEVPFFFPAGTTSCMWLMPECCSAGGVLWTRCLCSFLHQ